MSKLRHKPQITANQIGIGSILKNFWLKVPPHQREYRWTDSHVLTLFEDLHHALTSDDQEYFLGTIVTIPDADGALEVIDGQQRLATVAILLSRIRWYFQQTDAKLAPTVIPFLYEYNRQQKEDVVKLRLNLIDNHFFASMLIANSLPTALPRTAPVSNKRLQSAFVAAEDYVNKIVAPCPVNARSDALDKWIDFIENGAEVILLRAPTEANAYKMFETLNARGLGTTQADLVKNYLFGQAGNRCPEAQAAWSSMTGGLALLQGDDDEKDDVTVVFLRCALMAIHGLVRKDEVYKVVQSIAKGPQSVITLSKNLEELAAIYVATFYQDHEKWAKSPDVTRHAIQTINDFDIKPFRPVLLSVAGKFAPAESTKAFQMFVALGVRLLIAASTRTGMIEETLGKAANKIFKGEITTARGLAGEIASIIPSDTQFRQAFERYTASKAQFARYYLRAMEFAAQPRANPWYVENADKEKMTLEHVLPKEPGNNWPKFTPQEADLYCNWLGNMCLLPKEANNDLRSADQKKKWAVYKEAPYALTREIASVSDWTPQTLEERQKALAKLAVKTWPSRP